MLGAKKYNAMPDTKKPGKTDPAQNLAAANSQAAVGKGTDPWKGVSYQKGSKAWPTDQRSAK
jgi:hypothetical protein